MNKPRRIRKRYVVIAAAVALIAAAVVFSAVRFAPVCLVLRDADTGKRIAAFRLPEDRTFSVRFVHSVNKSPVEEFYEARGTDLFVTGSVYGSLGAGVETTAREGEQMLTGPEGDLRHTGIERKTEPLVYIVGTRSDHELIIENVRISLTELCGRNARVLFEARRLWNGREPSGYGQAERNRKN